MSSQSYLISLASWYFLPNLVTGWGQTLYYSFRYSAGTPHPQPGTPVHTQHRRIVYTLVIAGYLLFTVYQSDWDIRRQGDFYNDFGLPIDASERTISRTLKLALARAHPDKVAPALKDRAEFLFIKTKIASDTLTDPVKRFAYDRFGPEILEWKNCKVMQDYVAQGAKNSVITILSTLVVMLIAQTMGQMSHGTYWRYLSLAALFVFEAHTMTRPAFPRILTKLLNPIFNLTGAHPPYLPFQLVRLARQSTFSFFIAVNQLAPAWTAPNTAAQKEVAQTQLLRQLSGVISATRVDSERLLAMQHAPFAGNARLEGLMRERTVEWLVQNEVKNDPTVRAAMARAIERRNNEGRVEEVT